MNTVKNFFFSLQTTNLGQIIIPIAGTAVDPKVNPPLNPIDFLKIPKKIFVTVVGTGAFDIRSGLPTGADPQLQFLFSARFDGKKNFFYFIFFENKNKINK